MLIFGSHVHKAKLTLHAKIRCHRPTFFSKRYLRVFGHGFLFLKASLILLFGAEHVFNKLQAPTPPPPFTIETQLTLNKKYVHNTQHTAFCTLFFFFFFFFKPSLSTIFIFPSSIDIANMHTNFRHPSSTPSKKKYLKES